jgi:hypothetical protein
VTSCFFAHSASKHEVSGSWDRRRRLCGSGTRRALRGR